MARLRHIYLYIYIYIYIYIYLIFYEFKSYIFDYKNICVFSLADINNVKTLIQIFNSLLIV